MSKRLLLSVIALWALMPGLASACACGCGVFDVSTGSMLPTESGGMAWLEYDFMNQAQNWHHSSSALRDDNSDKQIRTDFITAGTEYMFDRSWGASIEVPYENRYFKTIDDNSDTQKLNANNIGDVRLRGIYSGFSDDMSTGITYGLKLPTGPFTTAGFDRDTQLGTGSTDLLLGAYHSGVLTDDNLFNWFVHGQWSHAFLTQLDYRPGDDFNAATGIYYNDGLVKGLGKISPLLQVIGSYRMRDSGGNADAADTGYQRLMLSPGIEYDVDDVKLYGDIEVPVYQFTNGDQLTAPVLFKFLVGYKF